MSTVPFSATKRDTTGKGVARKLRAAGQVPAVIYGHARQPQPLALDHHKLQLLLEKHPYQSTVIALDIDGATSNTLIREIQRHPFKKQIVHVDFQELVAGETVTVACRFTSRARRKASASAAGSSTRCCTSSRSPATRRTSRAISRST